MQEGSQGLLGGREIIEFIVMQCNIYFQIINILNANGYVLQIMVGLVMPVPIMISVKVKKH